MCPLYTESHLKKDWRAGRVAQGVEHLPSKSKALSSNPSMEKGRKGERKEEREGAKKEKNEGGRKKQ
jgi:hypothetical protein